MAAAGKLKNGGRAVQKYLQETKDFCYDAHRYFSLLSLPVSRLAFKTFYTFSLLPRRIIGAKLQNAPHTHTITSRMCPYLCKLITLNYRSPYERKNLGQN